MDYVRGRGCKRKLHEHVNQCNSEIKMKTDWAVDGKWLHATCHMATWTYNKQNYANQIKDTMTAERLLQGRQ